MAFNHVNPSGFDTQDIFVEHPARKGWYRLDSRADDVTVLSNGEKTNNKQIGTLGLPAFLMIIHN